MTLLDALGVVAWSGRVVGADDTRELSLVWLVRSSHTVLARLRDDVEERSSWASHCTTASRQPLPLQCYGTRLWNVQNRRTDSMTIGSCLQREEPCNGEIYWAWCRVLDIFSMETEPRAVSLRQLNFCYSQPHVNSWKDERMNAKVRQDRRSVSMFIGCNIR